MYKIMLADDEGIVIDSLKYVIEKEFGDECMENLIFSLNATVPVFLVIVVLITKRLSKIRKELMYEE